MKLMQLGGESPGRGDGLVTREAVQMEAAVGRQRHCEACLYVKLGGTR